MSPKFFLIVAGVALSFLAVIIALYLDMFGINRAHDQAIWGAFGDYFGGILNPIFALAAFFGVLWSLDLQMKQVRQLSIDKQSEEILLVIKDIDTRIGELLGTSVGGVGKTELFMHHMVAESERKAGVLDSSDAYAQFIYTSKQRGSMLEALTRELKDQIITMHRFLIRYPQKKEAHYAPIIEYYIGKTSRFVPMFKDLGNLPDDTLRFFETACKNG